MEHGYNGLIIIPIIIF